MTDSKDSLGESLQSGNTDASPDFVKASENLTEEVKELRKNRLENAQKINDLIQTFLP